MSDLIAVAYPDQQTAESVREKLRQLTVERVIELEDAVVVTRDSDGKVHLHQSVNTTAVGATGGALWGGLIGLLSSHPCSEWLLARRPEVWRATSRTGG